MSLTVSLHPSHTQMALKDSFLFSVFVNYSYFTRALKVSVPQDLIFGPSLSSELAHPSSLRVFTTTCILYLFP